MVSAPAMDKQAPGYQMISRVQTRDEKKVVSVKGHRWYLGGCASAGATLFTHPLDLLKVGLSLDRLLCNS